MDGVHVVEWRPNIYVLVQKISPTMMLISTLAFSKEELSRATIHNDMWEEVISAHSCSCSREWIWARENTPLDPEHAAILNHLIAEDGCRHD